MSKTILSTAVPDIYCTQTVLTRRSRFEVLVLDNVSNSLFRALKRVNISLAALCPI